MESNEETTKKLAKGLPIQYRVDFSNRIPVPLVKQIMHNGVEICSGPGGYKI